MLFLLRPRQTWMPIAYPRTRVEQDAHYEQLQKAYGSTRRTAAPQPAPALERDLVTDLRDLGALHQSGALTDDEFAAAKAKLLAQTDGA